MKQAKFSLNEKLRGFDLAFKTTFGLFSYKKIDEGTRLLIDNLEIDGGSVCLDLGCGYGPIGIVLAKLNPNGQVYFADRDFVAVEYVKKNCQLNDVDNYQECLSDGFNHIKGIKFDLIASNLPTHTAQEALIKIIADAKNHPKKDGKFYVVAVSKVRPFIKRQFENIFGRYEKVAQKKGHSVSLAMAIN